ncbi:MAG TPA: sigma-54 dependent transcriptional regulator [Fibrobacteraceae bacterium]|nr:sigma-54 dependent transcriptional regulator [Fibrobacteraceae bacterium]
MRHVMLVDDETGNRKALSRLLSNLCSQFTESSDGADALVKLQGGLRPDLIILDLMMPRMDGIELLRRAADEHLLSGVPIIVCSANTEIQKAVEAMKLGAADYIEKPIEPELFRRRVQNILERQDLHQRNEELRKQLRESAQRRLVGNSIAIQNALTSVERLANSSSTVLIHGESGTGKELVARSLHDVSERAQFPFMVVDCAAIHGHTIESELFGHERGAYTGADQKREGLLISAGKGTVFFDEVGELPLDLQAKLLRVLQERQVRPLGSTFYRPLGARVVAATNRDLLAEVKAGRFREDLYYRLSIVQLRLPSLRERREDIELLASHFLNKYAPEYGRHDLTHAALDALVAYDWPGNVRQLENAVHHALALAPQDTEYLDVEQLPEEVWRGGASLPVLGRVTEAPSSQAFPLLTIRELEHQAMQRALEFTHGNRRQAAEILGIGEATLYRKIKEFNL